MSDFFHILILSPYCPRFVPVLSPHLKPLQTPINLSSFNLSPLSPHFLKLAAGKKGENTVHTPARA